jgi:hypothetical protein
VVRLAGVTPILQATDNIELTERDGAIIAIELENKQGSIELQGEYKDILTDKTHMGTVKMDAFSVMVLVKQG